MSPPSYEYLRSPIITYSVLPYFLAKFSVECIVTLGQVLFQLVASFWLMGFRQVIDLIMRVSLAHCSDFELLFFETKNFLLFLLVNYVLGLASTSIGLFVGSMVENPDVAAELMPALIVPQLLFAGVFIQVNLIPEFLRWAQYLCSLTYAIRLVLLNEFSECADNSEFPNPCEQTLQYAAGLNVLYIFKAPQEGGRRRGMPRTERARRGCLRTPLELEFGRQGLFRQGSVLRMRQSTINKWGRERTVTRRRELEVDGPPPRFGHRCTVFACPRGCDPGRAGCPAVLAARPIVREPPVAAGRS
ncbi:hypothetical protein THAOC_33095 [Thalassiosira oceanica]|uniref:ABC-2 type transporter transmembrane domain-containing protein n=1 Tax=Thalassiosira oceanica TaxID=159749 RepID=K0RN17_THAOC|nr:hypothetical protein THAOC_33095 [Thalassiosira oceanica]|eukprot:EJK48137.1 hypothetical protein THAOC_33095 [Thalassiosira oceanica]